MRQEPLKANETPHFLFCLFFLVCVKMASALVTSCQRRICDVNPSRRINSIAFVSVPCTHTTLLQQHGKRRGEWGSVCFGMILHHFFAEPPATFEIVFQMFSNERVV